MSKKSDAKDGIFGDEFTLAKADKDDSQPQQTISKPKKKSSTKDFQQDKQQLTQQQKQQRTPEETTSKGRTELRG